MDFFLPKIMLTALFIILQIMLKCLYIVMIIIIYACEPNFRNVDSGFAVFGVGGYSIEVKRIVLLK